MKKIVCIDIGGTMIKYGLLDETGKIIKKNKEKTAIQNNDNKILEQVTEIIKKYQRQFTIDGIAISTAGIVDSKNGTIIHSGIQIPNYTGTKFKDIIEEKFKLPCEIENDVNCAGLSEVISGSAQGSKSTVCLTVGTGIGGCYLIGRKVVHGANFSAGEVGYMGMHGKEFQQLASTSALIEKVASFYNEPTELWNGEKIFKKAKDKDAICISAIDDLIEVLSEGIANICYVVNPEIIVLGGGIMEQKEYLLPRLKKSLSMKLIPFFEDHTTITMAYHKNDAGMLGALYNFLNLHQDLR